LTRSLGHQLDVEIDIEQLPLAVSDTLLLCSDGLWGFVPDQEIERTVNAPGMTLNTVAHFLLEMALTAGGGDNIGIEMARVVGLPNVLSSTSPSYEPISHHTVLWVVLIVFMMAFAGFCVIAYFALLHH